MSSFFYETISNLPPFSLKEICRYANAEPDKIPSFLEDYLKETEGKFSYRVGGIRLPVDTNGNLCRIGPLSVRSNDLEKNLRGCKEAFLFAATIGIEMDRMIARALPISPSKALWLQAIGTERIEALCNAFCRKMAEAENKRLRPRFSPGYGDVPLDIQRDIFRVLDGIKLGICLNESLLMSPTKSVTAFIGIPDESNE